MMPFKLLRRETERVQRLVSGKVGAPTLKPQGHFPHVAVVLGDLKRAAVHAWQHLTPASSSP
jgi:hypothetical protein